MESRSPRLPLKLTALAAFLAMITVNALSSILPINGVTPADVSARYPNLFVPAGFTFSIWGVIYLLLAGYVILLLASGAARGAANPALMQKTALWLIVTSVLNLSWVFAWHYGQLLLSFCILVAMLVSLIAARLAFARFEPLSRRERWLVRLPFSVYFAWLCVATIAGAAALLVGSGFSGFGLSAPLWTVLILAVGAAIGLVTAFRFRDLGFLCVFVWAYAGILANHLSGGAHGGAYPSVIAALIACLALFAAAGAVLLFIRRKPAAS